MNEIWDLLFAVLVGMLLGLFFFGGLWWTVRKGMASKYAALWFMGSMLLRTGGVMLGFYFVLGDDWRRLFVGLLGFVVARFVVIRLTRGAAAEKILAQEGGHAS